eukprot:CAMPEP_0173181814 /NCGR_PEP_ID=MMETSP1141-20130122/7490_1 /TAXON_ID=483371 /ORGANISM="non described non described, Strain CCMP2298" /LENGTH=70 /DNA_ID=CAMNT_0014104837 /DNA_START=543 /DNA_END=755 /DNA_ORIENTATION=+
MPRYVVLPHVEPVVAVEIVRGAGQMQHCGVLRVGLARHWDAVPTVHGDEKVLHLDQVHTARGDDQNPDQL